MLTTHPRVLAANENVKAADQDIRQAFGSFLPDVTLSGDAGREVVDNPSNRSARGETSKEFREKMELTITQRIFDGFEASASHSRAQADAEAQRAERDRVVQQLIFEGISAHLNLLKQRALVQLATQNEQIIKQ